MGRNCILLANPLILAAPPPPLLCVGNHVFFSRRRNEIKAKAESIFQAATSIGIVTCVHVGIRIYSHVTRYIYIVHSTTAVRVLGGCLHCNIEERFLF